MLTIPSPLITRRPSLRATLTLALLCAVGAARAELPPSVLQLMQAANIPEDAVGLLVLRGDRTVLAHEAARPMLPASTIKLVSSIVALDELGPVFRGRTELRTSADIVDGTLKGDLVLRGGADADFNEDALRHMLQNLRNQGVRRIAGDLIVDRQLFQPARPDLGAPQFDATPEWRYNVVPDALLLNTNMLAIDLRSNGKQLKLAMTPALDGVTVSSAMTLVDAVCAQWEDGWKSPEYQRDKTGRLKVILHGTFPKNCSKSASINVLDRADYTDRLFRSTWKALGGSFGGGVHESLGPDDSHLLAEHQARPLPEILRDMNKWSDNTLARLLYLSLGSLEADASFGSRPLAPLPGESALPTAARSERVIRAWLRNRGIDDSGIVLENGSGLSRIERISPAQLGAVLKAASQSLWAPEFLTSLPIAAVDGTMRRRLAGTPAAMRARLKTGTLSNAVAVAGYVPDANNQRCIVVVMVNHDHVGGGVGRAITDAVVEWVAHEGIPAQEK